MPAYLTSVRVLAVTWALAAVVIVPQLLPGSGRAAEPPPAAAQQPRAAERELVVAWVGDITPGSRYGLPPEAGRSLFAHVRPLLRRPDLTIGNLEGTLSTGGVSKCAGTDGDNCFSFQAPPENAAALADAGFDVLNLANNHAYDFGETGRQQTLAALSSNGVEPAGLPGEVTVVRRHGIDVAIVGFAPYPWADDLTIVAERVAAAKVRADVVLVLAHLGSEGTAHQHVPLGREALDGEDRGDTRAFAHAAIDAGADAVLASGPHVLRGIETYAGKPIAYSLGNFAGFHNFATSGALAETGILKLTLSPRGGLRDTKLVPLKLDAAGIPSPDPGGAASATVARLSAEDF